QSRMSPKPPLVRRTDNTRNFDFKHSDFFKPRPAVVAPVAAARTTTTSPPVNPFQPGAGKRTPTASDKAPIGNVDPLRTKRKHREEQRPARRAPEPSPSPTDEIVLSDLSDTDVLTDIPPAAGPSKPKMRRPTGASSPRARPLNDCEGMAFDFSDDAKVKNLKKSIIDRIIDPDGKKNRSDMESYVSASATKCVEELDTKKPSKKLPWKPGGGVKASFADFKSASGKPVTKDMKKVVEDESDSAGSTGSSNGTKYLGNRPIRPTFKPPSRGNSLNSHKDQQPGSLAAAMFDAAVEQTKNGSNPNALCNDPSLKHLDSNIVSLIESEIMSLSTETSWEDVAGLEGAKKVLKEIVVWPFLRPDIFKGIRAPPKGVLLFGPPGTGKTMIGRCVASQCKATFFNISASSLTSKWVGEGEKLVRALFAVARLKLPSVIFIDEVDSLLSSRSESEHESSRRIKTEFLVQLDGVATCKDERLLVLGATNRPYELDEAARRRFAKRLYVGLPERDARVSIVKRSLEGVEHAMGDGEYDEVAEMTAGYSGADMHQLCQEAAMGPVRDALTDDIESVDAASIRPIGITDLKSAARVVRATVEEKDLKAYSEWDKTFGCLL
ncbi:figl-1, partial [Pristionchus pacificus]